MKECQDCGDQVKRRTRCKNCGLLVCRWCYHHIHKIGTAPGNIVKGSDADQSKSLNKDH